MKETISIFAENIEYVSANAPDVLEISLSGVDLSQLVSEVGVSDLLDAMSMEDIKEFIENKEKDEDDE